MHADGARDDEFQAREADAVIGDLREFERALGIADVHHQLDRRFRECLAGQRFHFERQPAGIDPAGIALGARHRHRFAILQHGGRIAGADHGGDAQLARDDGRVAGAPAAVGDDRRGPLHHRLPIGVGHVAHQHVARLHAAHFRRAGDHPHVAGADLLPDGAAADAHLATALQHIAFDAADAARLHGFRPRLHDEQLAGFAVLRPFHVHRPAVVLLDPHRLARQFQHLGVVQGELPPQAGRRVLDHGRAVAPHHAASLFAEFAPHHRRKTLRQQRLVDVELVRIHRALHHRFAQTPGGGDEHHVAESGFRIQREQHAGAGDVRAHHALDAGGQRHLGVSKTVMHAIGDRTVVVERSEHLFHVRQQRIRAAHVQVGFLLAGERGIGQILGRGRRAHCHRHIVAERGIGRTQTAFQRGRQAACRHPGADLGPRLRQRRDVRHVERRQPCIDARTQIVMIEKVPECLRRGGKAARHPDARAGQMTDHFAE